VDLFFCQQYVDVVRKSFSSKFPKVVFHILVSVQIFAAGLAGSAH